MSEKLTPTRFSQVKNISGTKNGKSYAFNSIGFQTREYGDRWFNFAFNGDNPLKEGETYELDIKERSYTDKEGKTKTAYDAKKPSPLADFAKTIMLLSVRVGALEKKLAELEKPVINVHPFVMNDDVPPHTEDDFQDGSVSPDFDL